MKVFRPFSTKFLLVINVYFAFQKLGVVPTKFGVVMPDDINMLDAAKW